MLFNSYLFLFFFMLFFPLYYFLNPIGRYFYLLFSGAIIFYDSFYLLIFLSSVMTNGLGAYCLTKLRDTKQNINYYFLIFVSINIVYLSYFKYFYSGIIPLAISFYTFEQITYLSYVSFSEDRKEARFCLSDYLLFIAFFPRLLAGPIYYYEEYKDKLKEMLSQKINWDYINKGLAIFSFGLFKKVICADRMALIVDPFYQNPETYSTLDTWFSTLAYSIQIYLDFSAYSEMALGIGMMLGILLPLNFNSPYKATSIIDFWSRWHMTLSRFIKDYIYIPLGGNKNNRSRNIIITMLLAGLWHGVGLTFLLWGGVHGLFIALNHVLRRYSNSSFPIPISVKIFFTFIFINTTWILFRATSLENAILVFKQYIGYASSTSFHFTGRDVVITASLLAAMLLMPNVNDIFFKRSHIQFRNNIIWGISYVLAFFLAYKEMEQVETFIYFNF